MQRISTGYEREIGVLLEQAIDLERELEGASYSRTQGPKGEPELVKKLQSQIERFLKRRNDEYVGKVFLQYADKDTMLILPDKFHAALSDFGVHLMAEEEALLLTTMDIDNNGGLDLNEFTAALRQPSTSVEQFVGTLPISGMLASSLAVPGAVDSLKELCNLKSDQLKAAIEAFSVSVHEMLQNQLKYLKTLLDTKEAIAQEESDGSGSKCAVFVMNAGSVKTYHEGMYKRIGACSSAHSPAHYNYL